jgi:TRAP-type C4-dicarboxylate transport system substrate-binding protein
VAWPEVYLALKTGTVDAAEGPLDQMYATKFFEAAPYITLTNHLQQVFTVALNEAKYRSLPEDLRAIIDAAAREAGEYYQKLIREQFAQNRQKMIAEGAKISDVDTVPFQKMLEPVIKESEETGFWSKGLYNKIQALR